MNFKAMAAVVGLGLGGTVLALAATREMPESEAAAAEKPAPKPVVEKVVQGEALAQPEPKPTVVKVAPKAPPAVEKKPVAPKPTATQQQLDALMAPVALYPDQLLSQILMASTYPLDVVEAARWRARPENQTLSGEPLTAALENEDWDPSVKALVPFPEVLKMLDSDLDWMARVGDAFADQQADVMDSVQRLRREARAADKLNSDNRRQVLLEDDQIMIEPVTPDVVYVPFYHPADAYGVWPYPDYPPAYIPPPVGYTYAPYVVYTFVSINPYWRWSAWDWRHRHIRIVDPPRWKHYDRGHDNIWRHDSDRGGRGRGDRSRGYRPQPGVTPQPPIVVKDGDFPRRGNWDRNRDGRGSDGRGNAVNIDAPPAQPMMRPRERDFQRPPGGLPDMSPPLPASVQLPALAPPISNPNIGVQAPHNEQVDTMRARRRDQGQEQQWQQRGNDALRQRQFQDRGIGAPALSNVPPPQQQQRLPDTGVSAPALTNMQPPIGAQQQFPNRGQFGGQPGGQGQFQAPRPPQVPVAMPAPTPAIAPAAPQVIAPAPSAPQDAPPPARIGRGSFDPNGPLPNARTRENSR